MRDLISYHLPLEYDVERCIRESSGQLTVEKDPFKIEVIRFYDTFDWRLYNKSLVLYTIVGMLCLRRLSEREIIHCADITAFPVPVGALPAGRLKERLSAVVGVRALLKLAEIQTRSRSFRLLDRNRKTVVRLLYEELRSSRSRNAPNLAARIWLIPVKGYSRYSKRIARKFEEAGLTLDEKDTIYFRGLKTAGKNPGSYSSKITLTLEPQMHADEAIKAILRFLLRIMQINATHIEKDIDTEFLHDFRVAVRRTRAALGQIRFVFPEETTERFKKDFAYLGKLTNELRDLDVYLLKEEAFKARIAPALRIDIEPLFDYLRKSRSKAFQKVVCGLKSKRYKKIIKDWETFLFTSSPESPAAANAEVSVLNLAREKIYRKYRSVVKTGKQILESGDDQMLHLLRIHCKKLRYLMEFFAGLFPPDAINSLIEQLKKLQDNLGEFNDLRVQEEYLMTIAKQLPLNQGRSERFFFAIGNLIGALVGDRKILKEAFAQTFADFAAQANMEAFQNLFTAQSIRNNP